MNSRNSSFALWVNNRVLVAEVRGMWSVNTAMRYDKALRLAAQPLIDNPWGHIVLLQDWQLGTPDIEPVIAELSAWCIDNNLKRSAMIYEFNAVKSYQLQHMVPEIHGDFSRQHFLTLHEGIEWLAHDGFSCDAAAFESPS